MRIISSQGQREHKSDTEPEQDEERIPEELQDIIPEEPSTREL